MARKEKDLYDYMWQHLKDLGMKTQDEYKNWCMQNDLSQSLNKPWNKVVKEKRLYRRLTAEKKMAERRAGRNPSKVIEAIFRGGIDKKNINNPHLLEIYDHVMMRDFRTPGIDYVLNPDRAVDRQLKKFLLYIEQESDLFDDSITINGREHGIVGGILKIADYKDKWVRPFNKWKPKSHNARKQFSSLVRHLFAKYDVPLFMDSAWFERLHHVRDWFIHIGQGGNIRKAEKLPTTVTKKIAHYFLQAPPDYSPLTAIRWGQIHSLGGTDRLTERIISTVLSRDFKKDEFWMSVFKFFIDNPMLDVSHFQAAYDFIHHHKFARRQVLVAPGELGWEEAPQPNFTMNGRTPESLLRQIEQWHAILGRKAKGKDLKWDPCGLNEVSFREGKDKNMRIWTIKELLTSKQLLVEGREMKSCVSSYASSCGSGTCSIWSMTVESFDGLKNAMTIEVDVRQKAIVQALAKYNDKPTQKPISMLKRWANREGLSMSKYVLL